MNFNFQDLLKLKELNLSFSSNKMSSIQKLASTYSMTFREDKGSKLTIEEMDSNFHYLLENGGGGGTITGTPSGILYFDDNGDVNVDGNFARDGSGNTIIGTSYYAPNYPQFIGSGLNDISLYINGQFTGPTSSIYTITITGTNGASPSSDIFEWTCNTGASGSNVMNGGAQELDNNLIVSFNDTSNHNISDQWIISLQSRVLASVTGNVIGGNVGGNLSIGDDGIASIVIVGGASNNTYIGLIDINDNSNQANLQLDSLNGVIFTASIGSSNGSTYSKISVDPDGITFGSESGYYTMPKNNNTGYLKSKGDGTTSWNYGITATYSTGDGRIVTVTDGLITSIN